ncbi:hypothetical protein BpHYR1_048855 [Brachionus plicatilis]|uniref:Uncharacterized protein n=1 Tax=Brachionus plicatilis TaxID=10195 RepID=A0A3M7SM82_BRAPC|nr:hypothetical protein BpHYR1_048855 [Brachionus plicatilis]
MRVFYIIDSEITIKINYKRDFWKEFNQKNFVITFISTRALARYGCNINLTRDFECTLSKHANPVPCEICGELMKNIKGFTKN